MATATLLAFGLGAWPVSIVLRGNVSLIDSETELRPGLSSRGAFGNSGSRDLGPDGDNPFKAAGTRENSSS